MGVACDVMSLLHTKVLFVKTTTTKILLKKINTEMEKKSVPLKICHEHSILKSCGNFCANKYSWRNKSAWMHLSVHTITDTTVTLKLFWPAPVRNTEGTVSEQHHRRRANHTIKFQHISARMNWYRFSIVPARNSSSTTSSGSHIGSIHTEAI